MATFVPPQSRTPVDYHHSHVSDVDAGVGTSALEMAAYEKGRMAGELEAARRLEHETQHKTFNNNTTIINNNAVVAVPNIVEINRLTRLQWVAVVAGQLISAAYIVLMAIWAAEHLRSGLGWVNTDRSGSIGTFNTHIVTSFIGLWFMSQAYITYRILPLNTPTVFQKLWYTFCHAAALACFALSIAGAIMSNANTSPRSWSMHAWTSYLATLVYALHAFYSVMKVWLTRRGVSVNKWNETPSHSTIAHLTPEQKRDHLNGALYQAGPGAFFNRNRNIDVDARNAAHTSHTGPHWSERTLAHNSFFLVPRAKWAVTSLFGMMAVVLIGLGEHQVLGVTADARALTGPFSTLSGVIGLCVLAGVMLLGYAAMPPRTTLVRGNGVDLVDQRRTSISTATTAPNTLTRGVEVV